MCDIKNMAVFGFTGEWEQVTEIRDFLNERGADIPVDDDQSDENISRITTALINKCRVLATCSTEDAEMALNSIVTLISSAPDNVEVLVASFCDELQSEVFKGRGVNSLAGASFRVLQNLFHSFSGVPSCQFVAFKALISVASRAGLMSILDTSREAVETFIVRWELDVNQKREFLRLLHKALVADERTDAGAAVMIALLGTYSDSDAASAVDDARECVRTALADAKSFSFDHLLRLSAVTALEEADPLMFSALKMFSEGMLSDYRAFVKKNPTFVDQMMKVNEKVLLQKIRILTVMSMAATQSVISLDVLKSELEITSDEELEEFIITCVQLNAVNAKINEKTRTMSINSYRHRSFGRPQWEYLQERLATLIANLKLSHQSMKEVTVDGVIEEPAVETA